MTNDLDTRARAAARAVHDAVRDLPVTTVGPARAPHRGRLVLVAAAAVAVVALTAALVNRGEDDARVSTDPTAGVPRLVLDPVPAGMVAAGAVDLPAGDAYPTGTYWVYGEAGAVDPFEGHDLGLLLLPDDGTLSLGADGGGALEVDGHPAHASGAPDQQSGLRSLFIELDGSALGVLSRTLDDEELLAAAEELDLDAATFDAPTTVAGLDLVASADGAVDPSTMGAFPTTAGHLARYASAGAGGSDAVLVASLVAEEGTLAVAQWSLGGTAHPIDVDGATGWAGSMGDGSTIVIWPASPTELVALIGRGVDEAFLRAAATTVRPATDAEWTDLEAAAHEVSVPSDALVGLSSDEVDGPAYAAYVAADGSVCLAYDSDAGAGDSCSDAGGGQLVEIFTQRLGTGEVVVYGYTTLGTDGALRIEGPDGSRAGVMEAFGEDGTLFAGRYTDETLPAELVFRSAAGEEVGRVPVAGPGSEEGSAGVGFSGQGTPITEP